MLLPLRELLVATRPHSTRATALRFVAHLLPIPTVSLLVSTYVYPLIFHVTMSRLCSIFFPLTHALPLSLFSQSFFFLSSLSIYAFHFSFSLLQLQC